VAAALKVALRCARFDAIMEAGEEAEAFIIRVAEKVESPKTASKS
jgi:hypothetical protein